MHLAHPNFQTQARHSNTGCCWWSHKSAWPSDELVKSDSTKGLITEPLCRVKSASIIKSWQDEGVWDGEVTMTQVWWGGDRFKGVLQFTMTLTRPMVPFGDTFSCC